MKDPLNAVWMETHSGLTVLPVYPQAETILIRDIAHHLSQICRFNGACREFYSVAQHSVMVARQLPKELQLEGLLHDAAEAYTGDITRPMKLILDSMMLREVTWRLNKVIASKFGLAQDFTGIPEVVMADEVMLRSEAFALMSTKGYAWDLVGAIPIPIDDLLSCEEAEWEFNHLYMRLRRDE